MLVSPPQLADHLRDPLWRVVDCRFQLMQPEAGPAAYLAGHIPGAYYADLDKDLAAPRGPGSGRHPLPDPETLRLLFGDWGLAPEVTVVAYDDAGGAFAARLWWLLRWMGHARAALLDGGLPGWLEQGLPLDAAPVPLRRSRCHNTSGNMPVISRQRLEGALRDGGLRLLDARSPDRFAGRTEPVDAVAGHVPGAVNAPFEGNLASGSRFRSPDELRVRYRGLLGEHSAADTVCMCGSGVTACHTLFAMELAGLPGSRLYPGSWSEWINRESPAVATGDESGLPD